TFTFSSHTTPVQLKEFAAVLTQKALKATLLPLRPLDALDLSDLNGTSRAALRRHLLYEWHRAAAQVSQLDQRLRRHAAYRFGSRLLRGVASEATLYHH